MAHRNLYLLIVRHTAPLEVVEPLVPAHVAYLEKYHAAGVFVLSGPAVPESLGGAIIAHGRDREEIDQVTAEDPFVQAGTSSYEVVTIAPRRFDPALRDLLS